MGKKIRQPLMNDQPSVLEKYVMITNTDEPAVIDRINLADAWLLSPMIVESNGRYQLIERGLRTSQFQCWLSEDDAKWLIENVPLELTDPVSTEVRSSEHIDIEYKTNLGRVYTRKLTRVVSAHDKSFFVGVGEWMWPEVNNENKRNN